MSGAKEWWNTWSPLWNHIEDRHMSTRIVKKIIDNIHDPVLVIGAGQGLIVNYLRSEGYKVDGVDIEKEMVKMAKKRHSIDLVLADAKKLPFKNKSYKTVIISSGVVDYLDDTNLIKKIIDEGLRVTASNGNLIVAFYQEKEAIENIYRRIGVIDGQNRLHKKRIFDIDEISKKDAFKCIYPIMKWTNKGFLRTLFFWTLTGLTLPKEIKNERKKMEFIFDQAKKNNIDTRSLYNSIPDSLPYRDVNDIKKILREINYTYSEIKRHDDCIILKFYKSGFLSLNLNNRSNKKEVKNWVVKTENISKRYKGSKTFAVEHLNLSIPKGTVFGLLGPNGAGKTTALSILCRLLEPTSGNIRFSDKYKKNEVKKIIGYVPQELALYPKLTGKENLLFFGKLYGIKGEKLRKKVHELLSFVGLSERADDHVKKYSTGMKRRLNIAIGLINDPQIILLDEPTVGIDPQSRNYIFELVLDLKKKGATILYTTHYMEEADKLCDTVAIMDHGRVIVEDDPKALVKKYGFYNINFLLRSKYSTDFIRSLENLRSTFSLDIQGKDLTVISSGKQGNIQTLEDIKKISKKFKVDLFLKNITEPTLESIFLDITGRTLRDTIEEEGNKRIR